MNGLEIALLIGALGGLRLVGGWTPLTPWDILEANS